MLATVASAILVGVDGHPVFVEVFIARGLPSFTVVGLPDAACREARDRVRAAFASSGLDFPKTRLTVNLAPSGLRKVGAGLDLAIAVAILVAAGRVDGRVVERTAFFGELGLDGGLRPIPGVLSLVAAVVADAVVVPLGCVTEAALVGRAIVRGAVSLREVVAALDGSGSWPPPPTPSAPPPMAPPPDLTEVRGQAVGRWAVEVSAAGGHHLLFVGPPGAGKTMLAQRLPGLLPPLARADALDATRIHSAGGQALPPGRLIERPPFRAPHHTSTMVSLIGGGSTWVRPGEVSFAHRGVLFLDEFAEFPTAVLDTLRQPIEEGVVRVSRARHTVVFPARFLLVAAMNPCPCGLNGSTRPCLCSDAVRERYARRVSGPLLDRFDLRIDVRPPDPTRLLDPPCGDSSVVVAARVARARAMASERGVRCNAELAGAALDRAVALTPGARSLVDHHLRTGRLTGRGLDRIRRVGRTLADLAGSSSAVLEEVHVAGALALRADGMRMAVA